MRKGHRGRRGRLYGPMRTQSGGGSGPVTIVAVPKQTFGSADQVGNCVVFDVGSNRYRLIGRVLYPHKLSCESWVTRSTTGFRGQASADATAHRRRAVLHPLSA